MQDKIRLVEPLNDQPAMIVFFDPGVTTGYAYYTSGGSFHSGEAEFKDLGLQFELSASSYESALWIGWEDFITNSNTWRRPGSSWALEVIGMLRYLSLKYGCRILPPAPPAARNLAGLGKLKAAQWHRPGKQHANDAAQHLLSFMLREHQVPPNLLTKILPREPELSECEKAE